MAITPQRAHTKGVAAPITALFSKEFSGMAKKSKVKDLKKEIKTRKKKIGAQESKLKKAKKALKKAK